MTQSRSIDILRRLVAYPTVSRQPNLELIEDVRQTLAAHGIGSLLAHSEDGSRANLYASVGPAERPGVLLSGHTDVVPAEGQAWTHPPYALTEADGRLYGRGTADMKGFVACAVNAMIEAAGKPLARPLQLALSYDEEIGCVGVRRLLDVLQEQPVRPLLCLVGEPTAMRLALGHKGKTALRAVCHGLEAHSALAPTGLNAIHLAADFIGGLRGLQAALAAQGTRDDDYDVPYTTVHVGRIEGGRALNIVPNCCALDFEIRHVEGDDPVALIESLVAEAEAIAAPGRAIAPQARIEIETVNAYPGLATHPAADAVRFLETAGPAPGAPMKVAFGTEGGLFHRTLDVPAIVCGPGSMDQGHKPDEYVTREQMEHCDRFLAALTARLAG